MVTSNARSEDHFFSVNLLLKLLRSTGANADLGGLKYLYTCYTLFGKYMDHILVKFQQTRMVRNVQKFFSQKTEDLKTIFDRQSGTTI